MKKLIIFDCDGVLVDSEVIAHQVAAKYLADIGYPITLEESLRKFTGKNVNAIIELIFKESGIKISLNDWRDIQFKVLKAFSEDLSPLISDVHLFLREYSVNCCVASSSLRDRVCHALTITNQLQYFKDSSIFTSAQVNHGKPAPDLFLFAAKQMGYASQDCVVIEDSPSGIEAALAAHMPVIGFLGGTHTKYDWYQQKIKDYGIPVSYNTDELLSFLKAAIT